MSDIKLTFEQRERAELLLQNIDADLEPYAFELIYWRDRCAALESIIQAALRDLHADRLSPDSETYRALRESGMLGES